MTYQVSPVCGVINFDGLTVTRGAGKPGARLPDSLSPDFAFCLNLLKLQDIGDIPTPGITPLAAIQVGGSRNIRIGYCFPQIDYLFEWIPGNFLRRNTGIDYLINK